MPIRTIYKDGLYIKSWYPDPEEKANWNSPPVANALKPKAAPKRVMLQKPPSPSGSETGGNMGEKVGTAIGTAAGGALGAGAGGIGGAMEGAGLGGAVGKFVGRAEGSAIGNSVDLAKAGAKKLSGMFKPKANKSTAEAVEEFKTWGPKPKVSKAMAEFKALTNAIHEDCAIQRGVPGQQARSSGEVGASGAKGGVVNQNRDKLFQDNRDNELYQHVTGKEAPGKGSAYSDIRSQGELPSKEIK